MRPSLTPSSAERLTTRITTWAIELSSPPSDASGPDADPRSRETEPGFEIAQSMGIALLGLVVAAAFAAALEGLGADVITRIRSELGL